LIPCLPDYAIIDAIEYKDSVWIVLLSAFGGQKIGSSPPFQLSGRQLSQKLPAFAARYYAAVATMLCRCSCCHEGYFRRFHFRSESPSFVFLSSAFFLLLPAELSRWIRASAFASASCRFARYRAIVQIFADRTPADTLPPALINISHYFYCRPGCISFVCQIPTFQLSHDSCLRLLPSVSLCQPWQAISVCFFARHCLLCVHILLIR